MSTTLNAEERRDSFLVWGSITLGDGEDVPDPEFEPAEFEIEGEEPAADGPVERHQAALDAAVARVAARVEAGLAEACRAAGVELLPFDRTPPDGARLVRVEVVDGESVAIEVRVRAADDGAGLAEALRRLAAPA